MLKVIGSHESHFVLAGPLDDFVRADTVRARCVEAKNLRPELGSNLRVIVFFLEFLRDLKSAKCLDLILR